MSQTDNTQLATPGRRFAIARTTKAFHRTTNLFGLGRTDTAQVYTFCGSATAGEQTELFRADDLPTEVVSEHLVSSDPPEINLYAATGYTIGGAGLLIKEDRIWLPTDCYPGYLGTMCEQADGTLPHVWAGALNTEAPSIVRLDSICACPLHPNLVYGHFLMEMLPKLYLLRAALDMGIEFKIVLHRNLPNWTKSFIDLYFCENDLIWYDMFNEVVLPNAVLCPSMMYQENCFHPLLNVALEDLCLRAGLIATTAEQKNDALALVYLSRTRMAPSWHILINESDVEDTFRSAGFSIVHPQELTVARQLAIYHGADCLAGQYSSALHNALFCRRGAKILALNRINWYQSMIARLRGQRLGFLPPADGVMRDWRKRGNVAVEYTIDCAELKAYIVDFLQWQDTVQPPSSASDGVSSRLRELRPLSSGAGNPDREIRSQNIAGAQTHNADDRSSCPSSASGQGHETILTHQTKGAQYSNYGRHVHLGQNK